MYSAIGGALIGAWLIARGKPKTRVVKREALGTRTGRLYRVEEFPDAGMLIVSIPSVCEAVLERRPEGGFVIRKKRGRPDALAALVLDFDSSKR